MKVRFIRDTDPRYTETRYLMRYNLKKSAYWFTNNLQEAKQLSLSDATKVYDSDPDQLAIIEINVDQGNRS